MPNAEKDAQPEFRQGSTHVAKLTSLNPHKVQQSSRAIGNTTMPIKHLESKNKSCHLCSLSR